MDPWMISKAIVSAIGGVLSLLEVFGVVHIDDQEHLLTILSSIITPILVYLVPNAQKKTGK